MIYLSMNSVILLQKLLFLHRMRSSISSCCHPCSKHNVLEAKMLIYELKFKKMFHSKNNIRGIYLPSTLRSLDSVAASLHKFFFCHVESVAGRLAAPYCV